MKKYDISPELESIVTERFLEFTDKFNISPKVSVTKTGKFIDVIIESYFLDYNQRGTIYKSDITPKFLNEIHENFEFITDYFEFQRYNIQTEIHSKIPDSRTTRFGNVYRSYSNIYFKLVGRFTNNNINLRSKYFDNDTK